MLVLNRDLAVRISDEQPERHLDCPLTRLAAKPARLSIKEARMASRRSLRIGGHSTTVRLNLRSGKFGPRIKAHGGSMNHRLAMAA